MRLPRLSFTLWFASLGVLIAAIALTATIAVPGSMNELQAAAQQTSQGQPVKLYLTVRDKKGRPVTDLRQDEVRVIGRNREQTIESLALAPREPIALGLLFDTSGSRRDVMPGAERTGALQFIRGVIEKNDLAFVLRFSDDVHMVVDFTEDHAQLERGIQLATATNPAGSTALFDAIEWSCRERLSKVTGRRILVIVSDGADNASKKKLKEALHLVHSTGTTVFFIFPGIEATEFPRRFSARTAIRITNEMSDQTGGVVLFVNTPRGFESAFQFLAEEVTHEYVLRFWPADPVPGIGPDKIKVKTTRKGLTVRVRYSQSASGN